MRHVTAWTLALALALVAQPARADGTAETERFRITVDAGEIVTPGSTFELIINVENLTDHRLRIRGEICMKTPFGDLCGPVLLPRSVPANSGVEAAALMLCEEGTPLGDYTVMILVRSGREELSIPHTITVVEG